MRVFLQIIGVVAIGLGIYGAFFDVSYWILIVTGVGLLGIATAINLLIYIAQNASIDSNNIPTQIEHVPEDNNAEKSEEKEQKTSRKSDREPKEQAPVMAYVFPGEDEASEPKQEDGENGSGL